MSMGCTDGKLYTEWDILQMISYQRIGESSMYWAEQWEKAQFLFMNLFQMPNLRPLSFYLKHSLLSHLPGKQNTVTHRYAGNQLSDVRFRAFLSDFLNPFFLQVFCSFPITSLFLLAAPGILPDSLHFLTRVGPKNWTIPRAWSVPSVLSTHNSALHSLLYQQGPSDSSLSCHSQLGFTKATLSPVVRIT